MLVQGWNEFYEGWLARVLLIPFHVTKSDAWKDGWRMADETGDSAIEVLQAEIRLGHICVSHLEVTDGVWWCKSHWRIGEDIDEQGHRCCDQKPGPNTHPCDVVFTPVHAVVDVREQ